MDNKQRFFIMFLKKHKCFGAYMLERYLYLVYTQNLHFGKRTAVKSNDDVFPFNQNDNAPTIDSAVVFSFSWSKTIGGPIYWGSISQEWHKAWRELLKNSKEKEIWQE